MRHEQLARCLVNRGVWRALAGVAAAVAVGLSAAPAPGAGKTPKIIPVHPSGSRTPPVHRIQLFDRDDAMINVRGKKPSREPYTARTTCDKCHVYDRMREGWHFNAADPKVDPGRSGEPWIYVDRRTGTQIPLSNRKWPGTFRPADLKISNWRFVETFGRQMPGGGVGENVRDNERFDQSGVLDINCAGCHSTSGDQDQSAWAVNIGKYNFRWAATAASGLALVKGNVSSFPPEVLDVDIDDPDHRNRIPMEVEYFPSRFDSENYAIMDLTRRPSPDRCYFCHSTAWAGQEDLNRYKQDQDVHLAAGLVCTDCHRNNEYHHVVRGYEGEKPPGGDKTLTCRGCHMGDGSGKPAALPGRLGAPYPKHAGLPTVHLEKLSCTACHSGPWPEKRARRVQTSRSHGLGVHGKSTGDPLLPYVESPVFMKGQDGRIAPHHVMWPAYWARVKGGQAFPLPIDMVTEASGGALPPEPKGIKTEKYTPPGPQAIAKTLAKLAEAMAQTQAAAESVVRPAKEFAAASRKLADELAKLARQGPTQEQVTAAGVNLKDHRRSARRIDGTLRDLGQADARAAQLAAAAAEELNAQSVAGAEIERLLTALAKPAATQPAVRPAEAAPEKPKDSGKQLAKALAAIDRFAACGQRLEERSAGLADDYAGSSPGYVSAGKLYQCGKDGKLDGREHPAAKPYSWPFAHDVRPAGKALGAMDPMNCTDCHSTDSPLFFGLVSVEAPAPIGEPQTRQMSQMMGADGDYWKLFAMSFAFRPMLKIVGFACAAIIGAIVLLYGFLGLRAVLARIGSRASKG